MSAKEISLIIMAVLYIIAGIMHFIFPKFYLRIMPPYIPFHKAMVYLSGVAEIALGIGLFIPEIRIWSAWGVIALLVAVFPANVYHLTSKGAGMKVPIWGLWVRLPIQFLLIYWAFTHTY